MTETLPHPAVRLEAAFEAISGRMRGLGFFNPALRVEAVDFEPWQDRWLGVMVTPWFINLMLVPNDPLQWESLPQGATRRYRFPAGDYDFIGARDDHIGDYQMCSLFSPALEFADHEMARLVAKMARHALFDAANAPVINAEHGVVIGPAAVSAASATTASDTPVSKRDFLRGRFRPGQQNGP
jgi:[NiFe] hydrogenase assembly HybE family chaperone